MDWNGLLDGMTAIVRDTFGEPVSYWIEATGETIEIIGIFDPDFKEVAAGGTMPTLSKVPMLEVRVDDIGVDPMQGDRVTVQGRRYLVSAPWPSSSGMVKLQLRKI
jgi:hypothetical protein